MGEKNLKMYVWDGVLCDYSCGMVCVLAYDEAQARELGKACLESWNRTELDKKPTMYRKPVARRVYGGG